MEIKNSLIKIIFLITFLLPCSGNAGLFDDDVLQKGVKQVKKNMEILKKIFDENKNLDNIQLSFDKVPNDCGKNIGVDCEARSVLHEIKNGMLLFIGKDMPSTSVFSKSDFTRFEDVDARLEILKLRDQFKELEAKHQGKILAEKKSQELRNKAELQKSEIYKKCADALIFLDEVATRDANKMLEMIVGDLASLRKQKNQFSLDQAACTGFEEREYRCASNTQCKQFVFDAFETAKKHWRSEAGEYLFTKYKNYMFVRDCHEIRKDYAVKYIDPNVFTRVKNKMKQIESEALKADPSINKEKIWDDAAVEHKLGLGILTGSNKSNPQDFNNEVAGQCRLRVSQLDGIGIPSNEEDFKIKKDF
jgi:hypothetical protein